jgi:hypothetical protein
MPRQPSPDELELMKRLTTETKARRREHVGGERRVYGRGIFGKNVELTFDCPKCSKPIIVPESVQRQIANAIGVRGAAVELVDEPRDIMLTCPSCKSEWGIDIRKQQVD